MRYGTGKLAEMPQVVVVNKVDVWDEESESGKEEWEKGLKTKMTKDQLEAALKETMAHTRLMWMSAKQKDGVDDLMTRLEAFVTKVKAAQSISQESN